MPWKYNREVSFFVLAIGLFFFPVCKNVFPEGSAAFSNIMNNEFYTKWKPVKTGFRNITGPSQAENGR
jgi:hypothetical protein